MEWVTCVCVWLGAGGVVGEWMTGLGLGFTNSGGTRGKWNMCLCFGCGGVGWAAWARVWEGRVVLCMYVF